MKSPFFPDIPGLKQSLSKIIVSDFSKDEEREHEIVCSREIYNPSTKIRPNWLIPTPHDIAVILDHGASLSLETIASIVSKALDRLESSGLELANQAERDRLAILLVAIAKVTASRDRSVLESLDFVFHAMNHANVRLIAAIKCVPKDKSLYRFSNFQFGWLDLEEVKRLTLHAGSNDYFQLHRKSLENTTALVQDRSLFVLNASEPYFLMAFERKGNDLSAVLYRLLDQYYHNVAAILWRDFYRQLDEQQTVLAACASQHLPSRIFISLDRATARLAIFYRNTPQHGWVAPTEHFWSFEIPTADSLQATQSMIDDGLRLNDLGANPLDGILKRYSVYLADAGEYTGKDRAEVSLLHYVFALDLLLGGKPGEPLTAMVKDRTATLSFLNESESWEEVAKFLSDCYELRSSYVHRGGLNQKKWYTDQNQLLVEKVDRLSRLTRLVFASACWARVQPWCKSVDDWIARIDIMRLKLRAKISTQEDVSILGLDRIRQTVVGGTTIYTVDWDKS